MYSTEHVRKYVLVIIKPHGADRPRHNDPATTILPPPCDGPCSTRVCRSILGDSVPCPTCFITWQLLISAVSPISPGACFGRTVITEKHVHRLPTISVGNTEFGPDSGPRIPTNEQTLLLAHHIFLLVGPPRLFRDASGMIKGLPCMVQFSRFMPLVKTARCDADM